jgi:hypothetical protein
MLNLSHLCIHKSFPGNGYEQHRLLKVYVQGFTSFLTVAHLAAAPELKWPPTAERTIGCLSSLGTDCIEIASRKFSSIVASHGWFGHRREHHSSVVFYGHYL